MNFLALMHTTLSEPMYYELTKSRGTSDAGVVVKNYRGDSKWYGYRCTPDVIQNYTLKTYSDLDTQYSSHETYIHHILNAIDKGDGQKVVAARNKFEQTAERPDPAVIFSNLYQKWPDMFTFWLCIGGDEHWVGSSPELLGQMDFPSFNTISLAGTIHSDQVFGDKEIYEQQLVTDTLYDILIGMGIRPQVAESRALDYGAIKHIVNSISAQLECTEQYDQIVESIHPSPALCGLPREWAQDMIARYESIDRGYYTGLCTQYLSRELAFSFAFLRCSQVYANGLLHYAGGGVVAGSTAPSEWRETELKIEMISSGMK